MLTYSTQAQIAFKNIYGKSQTDSIKNIGNENDGISFNLPSSNIWLDTISTTASAISNGITLKIMASMSLIPSTQNKGFYTIWPTVLPSITDIKTGITFSYGIGTLIGITAGMKMTNIIPDFGIIPYSINGIIYPDDSRNWIYQYNSGIFYQDIDSGIGSYPTTASVYPYIGNTLNGVYNNYNSVLNGITSSMVPILYNITNKSITVPDNYIYMVYGSLGIGSGGTLSCATNGRVIILNGTMSVTGGTYSGTPPTILNIARKYTSDFSLAISLSKSFTHSFNTQNVQISVRDGNTFIAPTIALSGSDPYNAVTITAIGTITSGSITIIG